MPRGGARPGAGRKGLTAIEKLLIGNERAQRWRELADRQAIERHKKQPETRAIEIEQSRAHFIPKHLRHQRQRLADISESIDEITEGRRYRSIPKTRPYGSRTELLQPIVAWCFETYGLRISTSQARESWKKFAPNENSEVEETC